jgi:hypothetical protein
MLHVQHYASSLTLDLLHPPLIVYFNCETRCVFYCVDSNLPSLLFCSFVMSLYKLNYQLPSSQSLAPVHLIYVSCFDWLNCHAVIVHEYVNFPTRNFGSCDHDGAIVIISSSL